MILVSYSSTINLNGEKKFRSDKESIKFLTKIYNQYMKQCIWSTKDYLKVNITHS